MGEDFVHQSERLPAARVVRHAPHTRADGESAPAGDPLHFAEPVVGQQDLQAFTHRNESVLLKSMSRSACGPSGPVAEREIRPVTPVAQGKIPRSA